MGVRTLPSEAEIAVLEALAVEGEALGVQQDGRTAWRARLLLVDPARRFLVVGSSGEEARDAQLLSRPGVEFVVESGEWRIAFTAEAPSRTRHRGVPAIRVAFPAAIAINRRRVHERAAVPDSAPLRCVAYSGAAALFDAAVCDLSQGGVGLTMDFAGGALEPGMVLAGCRIEGPGREAVVVDLEVRHTAVTTFPDGRRSIRAGCRFVNLTPKAASLVAAYAGSGAGAAS